MFKTRLDNNQFNLPPNFSNPSIDEWDVNPNETDDSNLGETGTEEKAQEEVDKKELQQ